MMFLGEEFGIKESICLHLKVRSYGGLIQLCKPKTVDYEVLRESIHLLLVSAEDYIQT